MGLFGSANYVLLGETPAMKRRVDLNVGWAEDPGDQPLVEIGDRLVPPIIRVHLAGGSGQPQADLLIDSSSGVPRCTDLHVYASERGPEVRTRDLRLLNVEDLIDAVVPLFSTTEYTRYEDGSITAQVVVPDSDSEHYQRARR